MAFHFVYFFPLWGLLHISPSHYPPSLTTIPLLCTSLVLSLFTMTRYAIASPPLLSTDTSPEGGCLKNCPPNPPHSIPVVYSSFPYIVRIILHVPPILHQFYPPKWSGLDTFLHVTGESRQWSCQCDGGAGIITDRLINDNRPWYLIMVIYHYQKMIKGPIHSLIQRYCKMPAAICLPMVGNFFLYCCTIQTDIFM